MDLTPSAEQEQLRAELRDWLRSAVTWDLRTGPPYHEDLDEQVTFLRSWQRSLADGRWVGVHWPQEYGGRGVGPIESYVVQEELARAQSPELVGRIGVNLVGPTLLHHGTDNQKQRWLPRVLDASEIWCQLFSEPGAGSDLASLSTRADRVELRSPCGSGDGWRLSGQKVWTSYAQYADWGLCLARTNPDVPKNKGLTMFAVDMRSAGVQVRPLVQMTGEREFNEVFLDGVTVTDDARIGEVDEGWRVAGSTMTHERGLNPRQLVIHMQAVNRLFRLAADLGADADPRIRQRLAAAYADIRVFQLHSWRSLSQLSHGETLGAESSVVKLHWSQASQRLHQLAMDILGEASPLWRGAPGNPGDGAWQRSWLYYQASSIWAGTNEIQRNVLGERVLGLPREPVAAGQVR